MTYFHLIGYKRVSILGLINHMERASGIGVRKNGFNLHTWFGIMALITCSTEVIVRVQTMMEWM